MDDTKPNTEVVEETRETLSVLELDRTPRAEKLAAERAFFDGAHEVRFTQRTLRPKHGAAIEEIRAFIDSLEVRRRDVPPLPEIETPGRVEVPAHIPEHYRDVLERAIEGTLVNVETVHRVGTGTVVDVSWEPRDGGLTRGLWLVANDDARPYEEVVHEVDEMEVPKRAIETVAPPPPAEPAPTPEPASDKKRFSFGKKDKAAAEKPSAASAPAPEPAQEPEPAEGNAKKRRFGFGKK